jgi:hypothetical protein
LAIGATTRQTYSSGVKSFISFVDAHSIRPAFPATAQTLCLWLTFIASPPSSLTLGTCKVYLSAVITRHTELGLHHPLSDAPPMLSRILAGIKRMGAQPSRPRLPITTSMLTAMLPHLRLQQRRDSLLWAMMWTATTGLLRISEFATRGSSDTTRILCLNHLTFFDHAERPYTPLEALRAKQQLRYALLRLTASKTDPFRAGVDIVLSAPTTLTALLHYAAHLPRTPGPTTPLFQHSDCTAVTRSWLMKNVDKLLRLTGYDPRQYSSHSFRKGGAVSLQANGVGDSLIQRSGRWKSPAFNLYVRDPSLTTLIDTNAAL